MAEETVTVKEKNVKKNVEAPTGLLSSFLGKTVHEVNSYVAITDEDTVKEFVEKLGCVKVTLSPFGRRVYLCGGFRVTIAKISEAGGKGIYAIIFSDLNQAIKELLRKKYGKMV